MLEFMAFQSNIYSVHEYGVNLDTESKEIEKFIGCYFRMGLVQCLINAPIGKKI